ncbi:hypothetical protein K438DRAFT_1977401 [Mycena galopus ATCC 62051]|nr:hypothetical protein K438DRAFT_1977401 [Mycena galopus ATCC 62051]
MSAQCLLAVGTVNDREYALLALPPSVAAPSDMPRTLCSSAAYRTLCAAARPDAAAPAPPCPSTHESHCSPLARIHVIPILRSTEYPPAKQWRSKNPSFVLTVRHITLVSPPRTVLLIARSGDSLYGSAPITRTTLASSVHLRTSLIFDTAPFWLISPSNLFPCLYRVTRRMRATVWRPQRRRIHSMAVPRAVRAVTDFHTVPPSKRSPPDCPVPIHTVRPVPYPHLLMPSCRQPDAPGSRRSQAVLERTPPLHWGPRLAAHDPSFHSSKFYPLTLDRRPTTAPFRIQLNCTHRRRALSHRCNDAIAPLPSTTAHSAPRPPGIVPIPLLRPFQCDARWICAIAVSTPPASPPVSTPASLPL